MNADPPGDELDDAFEWASEESLRLAELGLPLFAEALAAVEEQERTEGTANER